MKTKIADLHCHSTFIPYNEVRWNRWYRHNHYKMKQNVWKQHRHLFFPSQGDLTKLVKGGTRVLFLTLYPIEQGFMYFNKFGLGAGDLSDAMARVIFNIPKPRADEIQDYDHYYFDDLIEEFKFLDNSPRSRKVRLSLFRTKEYKFRLVSNFNDLKNFLNLNEDSKFSSATDDTIAVILTIEGGHSLGTGQKNTLTLNFSQLYLRISKNIAILKNLSSDKDGPVCPFYISLCHFFWNQLGGHAVSLWENLGKIFDQKTGINNGIETLGSLVVDELLSTSNGKRILIDVAHMSINVRRWFYYTYLPRRKLLTGETIPVIVSHTGVNGWKDFSQSEILGSSDIVHEYADARYENSQTFNPWDVFISDEEILLIHDSGGLIGLCLDERIMMGRKTLKTLKKKSRFRLPHRKREIWIEPLIEEIIHVAGTIYKRANDDIKIWDNICIGSDYDGRITPIKAYPNAKYFPKLDIMLFEGLMKRRDSEEFLRGATEDMIRGITDQIVWKNALQFLKKHFI